MYNLKRKCKLLLLLTLLACSTQAQIIVKAGFNMSTTSSDLEDAYGDFKEKLKAGFVAGIGYQANLGNLSLQPELLFIQKGTTVKISFIDPPDFTLIGEDKVTINYLELPLMLRYNFGPEALRIYVSAGPSVSLGLGGTGKFSGTLDLGNGANEVSYEYKVKFEEEPEGYEGNDIFIKNKIDFGGQLGGGVVIASRIMFDLRYGMGFTDWGNEVSTKNRVLQLSVGILFGR